MYILLCHLSITYYQFMSVLLPCVFISIYVSTLLIFPKNQVLFSLISFFFSRLDFIYFCSDLYYFFLLLTLGFVHSSFPSFFKNKVRFSISFSFLFFRFFFLPEVALLLYPSFLELLLLLSIYFGLLSFHFPLSPGIF